MAAEIGHFYSPKEGVDFHTKSTYVPSGSMTSFSCLMAPARVMITSHIDKPRTTVYIENPKYLKIELAERGNSVTEVDTGKGKLVRIAFGEDQILILSKRHKKTKRLIEISVLSEPVGESDIEDEDENEIYF